MKNHFTRRDFLKRASLLPLCAAGVGGGAAAAIAREPIKRIGPPELKLSLNAYSFAKMLNGPLLHGTSGLGLMDLLDF